MKKILAILILIFSANMARAWYFDAGVDEIPLMIVGVDNQTNAFYSFFNIANLRLNFNVNDKIGLKFRLKDTYLALSNASQPNGTNKLYIDRLNAFYKSANLNVLVGRAVFSEGDGMVLGNLADGLRVSANLFGFYQRIYALYSGLLPVDVNAYNVGSQDQANGAQRLQAGLVLEKYGLLIRSIGLSYFYSKDLSTNQSHYNPQFIGLNAIGNIGDHFSLGANFYYSFGEAATNVTISSFAFNLGAQLKFSPALALLARISYASGDDTNTTTIRENFNGFGIYHTGIVLVPDFSNLLMFNVGVSSKLLKNRLNLGLGLYFMSRPSLDDSLNGFYTGTGATIGTEISASAVWNFDPNMSVLLTGGYFIKDNAFAAGEKNIYKFIGGLKFKL